MRFLANAVPLSSSLPPPPLFPTSRRNILYSDLICTHPCALNFSREEKLCTRRNLFEPRATLSTHFHPERGTLDTLNTLEIVTNRLYTSYHLKIFRYRSLAGFCSLRAGAPTFSSRCIIPSRSVYGAVSGEISPVVGRRKYSAKCFKCTPRALPFVF